MKQKILFTLLLSLFYLSSKAQNNITSFDFMIGYGEDGITSGFNFNFHKDRKQLWQINFFLNNAKETISKYEIPYIDATVSFSYNRRIFVNNQNNTFNVFLGAGLLGGYEYINDGNEYLPDGIKLKAQSKVIYGAVFQVQSELWLSDDVYLTFQLAENLHINSDLGNFLFYGGVGIRLYLL